MANASSSCRSSGVFQQPQQQQKQQHQHHTRDQEILFFLHLLDFSAAQSLCGFIISTPSQQCTLLETELYKLDPKLGDSSCEHVGS